MNANAPVLALRRLDARVPEFDAALERLIAFEVAQDPDVEMAVAAIVADVRVRGDAALLEYTERFDRLRVARVADLAIDRAAMHAAHDSLGGTERDALETAARRIRDFHERQKTEGFSFRDADGTELGQRITPLDSVGVYVPGGKAAYPSSVLMNAIPATVAGVADIAMAVPAPGGARNPLVLAAAHIAGVTRAYTIGGAQAIAALAYGTATIRAVDKICGPGNAYVAAAKRKVFGVVGIDLIAGASEVLVIADASANPDWIAIDLMSQAEHDEMAQAILLTPDAALIDRVEKSAQQWFAAMPRAAVIAASFARRGALVRTRDLAQACEIANRIAPEHLELAVADPGALLPRLRHAGAIFAGHYASEALGDYCAGPNHVLPTGRTARFSSPLGVYDFQKRTSVLRIARQTAQALAPLAATLAQGEGLLAHARAAQARMDAAVESAPALRRESPQTERRERIASTVREEVRSLTHYPVANPAGWIKLDAMENPYPLPADLAAALSDAVSRVPVNRYPDGGAERTKAALREALQLPAGVALTLGNGSDELIQILTAAVAGPRAGVLAPDPSFVMYRRSALAAHAPYAGVALREDFTLDPGAMLAAIERTRPALVWLAYPNNPTGNLFDAADVERIVAAAPGLVAIDEAYYAFADATFLPRVLAFPNLVVVRTVSKIGMAGLRLGYALGHPDWITEFDKLRPPYNVNSLTQAALPVLLAHAGTFARQAAAIRAERARLAAALAALPGVRVYPTQANFVLARVPDATASVAMLAAARILVRNLDGSHPLLAGCLRITVGTPSENDALLAVLRTSAAARDTIGGAAT